MSTEENKAFVRRWFEETAVNDYLALVDKIMAPDFVQHDPAGDMPLENFKQNNSMLLAAFPYSAERHVENPGLFNLVLTGVGFGPTAFG